MNHAYEQTAQTLVERVRDVARKHPTEVAAMTSPFDLFKLGLDTSGLDPSLAQAGAALAIVKNELRATIQAQATPAEGGG